MKAGHLNDFVLTGHSREGLYYFESVIDNSTIERDSILTKLDADCPLTEQDTDSRDTNASPFSFRSLACLLACMHSHVYHKLTKLCIQMLHLGGFLGAPDHDYQLK